MKKIVLFGSGVVAEQNLALKPDFIVDNNADIIGSKFHGLDIKSPDVLKDKSTIYQIVVCTTSVGEVKKQLTNYGFIWGQTANIAKQLAERSKISDLEEASFSFLISSGLPSSAESFSGGGIYKITEKQDYPEISKIYEGNTHGLISLENGYYAFTCQGEGIKILDNNLKVVKTIPLRKGLRPHGLKRYKDLWVLVSSNRDCILAVDDNGKEVFEYSFSKKLALFESPQHHCNDIEVVGDIAYVSMFSVTGNWKRNVFDGGIIEVNLINGSMTTIINNLTMPHSISYTPEQGLTILNSFKGTLLASNFSEQAKLPGFLRGYDSDESYHYLGESKNRNFSRLDTGRKPVSIDTRITIMNKEFGFSRSIQLPSRISELHAIILLKNMNTKQI
ncbi:DUF4915 domain-containing protein [Colwellia psychrerythraea]|uniref:Conserved hypothetical protein CHP03032 domain-containing protein n=1 Tax=Colwellia psychrerythraea TaxID=28229 RepID=A0A099L545_COLPS|nr:DUF4915 domain-containing protein [Colwellia psychrerythraea]KGJ97003.1 hypothetical protein GAB14E_1471 [Colwellia psychrerythraea]